MNATELPIILEKHAKWLRDEAGGERANLSGANLSRADLRGADLSGANLSRADLSWAKLSGAKLSGANLSWADLSEAKLSRAKLSGANLSWADLSEAKLSRADLSWADLSWAKLRGADLSGANLSRADLSWAKLKETCLDPKNKPNADWPDDVDAEGYVIGYRSRRFGAIGGCEIKELGAGETVKAEAFSTADTECHPGIYLWPTLDAAKKWVDTNTVLGAAIVKVRARKADIHHAVEKWRAREISVLEIVEE